MIVLGYIEDGTEEHLNLGKGGAPVIEVSAYTIFLEHPLADDFDITQGHIDVTVPYVDPRNDYIIVRKYSVIFRIYVMLIYPF